VGRDVTQIGVRRRRPRGDSAVLDEKSGEDTCGKVRRGTQRYRAKEFPK